MRVEGECPLMGSIFGCFSLGIISILIAARENGAHAPSPPLWGKLAPGPYSVGFRSVWQMDYSRKYNTVFESKTVLYLRL